ncbi:hypothetical protein L964_505 [Leuconostoc pseudomesenteroides 1159]|nr:hypothetical protein L964_505 [Leuconostoc pseudomesenteroides 1159]
MKILTSTLENIQSSTTTRIGAKKLKRTITGNNQFTHYSYLFDKYD